MAHDTPQLTPRPLCFWGLGFPIWKTSSADAPFSKGLSYLGMSSHWPGPAGWGWAGRALRVGTPPHCPVRWWEDIRIITEALLCQARGLQGVWTPGKASPARTISSRTGMDTAHPYSGTHTGAVRGQTVHEEEPGVPRDVMDHPGTGMGKLQPGSISGPLTVFVNKVLLTPIYFHAVGSSFYKGSAE